MIKSMYIHIPFCKNICSYCDFSKMYYSTNFTNNYLDALFYEIKSIYKNEVLKTLYIGGGTPSVLSILELNKLFDGIKDIKLESDYEFTIECNIEDICIEKLELFKKNRVNRLSIGIQSFNKNHIKYLNRNHKVEDVFSKINLAKKYFDNINIDLIFGMNNETMEELNYDLDNFLKLNIDHISIYSLIIEPHTVIYNKNDKNINEELEKNMYYYIKNILEKNGYNHYEVSNYSKNNKYSRHNICYWSNEKYYGFGLGTSSYIENKRITNTRNINDYMNKKFILNEEIVTKEINMQYDMILNLRKRCGISNKEFYKKHEKNISDVFNTKNLIYKNDFYYIDANDIYIMNDILEEFV